MPKASRPSPGRGTTGRARIWAVSGYLPATVVANDEVCARIDSSDEWIRQRSGIAARHVAGPDESVVDMGAIVGARAVAAAGIEVGDLDAVIVATITHPSQTPAAAPQVCHRLGITAGAFDLSGACSGYCQAVAVAQGLVQGGNCRFVLVVGADKMTDFVDWNDRNTAFLFGDGAGAAVVGPAERSGIGPVVWGSDGGRSDIVGVFPDWGACRDRDRPGAFRDGAAWPVLGMNGKQVYKWASYELQHVVHQAAAAAGIELKDLKAFIPHQANVRIIDDLVRTVRLPPEVHVARHVHEAANTSAASIPLAMTRLMEQGVLTTGDLVLQMGFGAGLAYAAQVVTTP